MTGIWEPMVMGKKVCQTRRPDFISTVRPDLSQSTLRFKKEDTLGGILFLRLKPSHLRPVYHVSGHVLTIRENAPGKFLVPGHLNF
jgi:hypothetical protein